MADGESSADYAFAKSTGGTISKEAKCLDSPMTWSTRRTATG